MVMLSKCIKTLSIAFYAIWTGTSLLPTSNYIAITCNKDTLASRQL